MTRVEQTKERLAQQLIELQNRITHLTDKGQLGELTSVDVALISYALGGLTGQLLQESPESPEEALKSLAAFRRAAKKAGVNA